jgi:hypothetical protein
MSLSAAAQAFVDSLPPEEARRWLARSGAPVRHGSAARPVNPDVPSPFPRKKVDPFRRDFGPLKPSSVARHRPTGSKAANEHEPMREGTGVEFQVGSRAHAAGKRIGKPPGAPKGALGRDIRAAAAKRASH